MTEQRSSTGTAGYTEAEGYAASLRQQADWSDKDGEDVDTDELRAAAEFIERQDALIAILKDASRAQQPQGCAHPADDLKFGPHVPVRWGTALTQVCKCGAWRTMHHTPGRWQTTALPSTDREARHG